MHPHVSRQLLGRLEGLAAEAAGVAPGLLVHLLVLVEVVDADERLAADVARVRLVLEVDTLDVEGAALLVAEHLATRVARVGLGWEERDKRSNF